MLTVLLATMLAGIAPDASPSAEPAALPSATAPAVIEGAGRPIRRWAPAVMASFSPDDAVIVNSGSTNTVGYTIVVHPRGDADVYAGDSKRTEKLDPSISQDLFQKLRAAQPFSSIVAGRCMKSASFGTSTMVHYQGQTSPDLSCGASDGTARDLMRSVGAVVEAVHLQPAFARRHLL
jgi:hypothetical protein